MSFNFFSNPNNYKSSINHMPGISNTNNLSEINIYDINNNMYKKNQYQNPNQNLNQNHLENIHSREEIREYSVMIDSKDRNYQMYPDPFSYVVKFNPLIKTKEKICGKTVIFEEPNPVIYNSFVNVRYIKLESIILPFYTKVKYVSDTIDDEIIDVLKVDTLHPATDNLYTVMSIGEYIDTNHHSTNDVLSESFATIYYDNKINNTHYTGHTFNGIKIFPLENMAKINKMKINFMDPYGQLLKCPHLNKNIRSNMECTCDDPDGDDDTDCFKHNLNHPLNPIFQHHIHFKIGVVEPKLNRLDLNLKK